MVLLSESSGGWNLATALGAAHGRVFYRSDNDTLIANNVVARVGAQFSGGFGFDTAQAEELLRGPVLLPQHD